MGMEHRKPWDRSDGSQPLPLLSLQSSSVVLLFISNILRHVGFTESGGKTHLRYLCYPRRISDRMMARDNRDSGDRGRTQKAGEGGIPLLFFKFRTVTPFPGLLWYWKTTGTGSTPVMFFCNKALSKVLPLFWGSRR